MLCPKCGKEQPDGGSECLRCGVIFGRYRGTSGGASGGWADAPPPAAAAAAPPPAPPGEGEPRGWEPAAVGGRMGRNEEPPTRRWSGGEQLYGGPAAVSGPLAVAAEPPPPELSGNIYEGPPVGESPAAVAAVGMALRPAARATSGGGLPDPPAMPFSFSLVMADTCRIFFSNLLPFLLIALVVQTPLVAAMVWLTAVGRGNGSALLVFAFVGLITAVVSGPLLSGAITYGVAADLRRRESTIGQALARAAPTVLSILGVALLQGLVTLGGFLLCVVPGLIAVVALAVAVPVAVEERPGVLASLARSVELTSGYRWTVAGVLLTLLVIHGLLDRALSGGVVAAGGLAGGLRLPAVLVGLVLSTFEATAMAVTYYRLRSAEAGVEPAALPSVFD